LSPREVAGIVAGALPAEIGAWVYKKAQSLGWLDAGARIPIGRRETDVISRIEVPAKYRGGGREILRLAVFGIPGEGARSESRRREAIFQQRCSEIMREARDPESLAYVGGRALAHPEVQSDPVLTGMLRAFISEREAELRARAHLPLSDSDQPPVRRSKPVEYHVPLSERVRRSFGKLRIEIEQHISVFNEAGANETLARMRDLRRRYPGHVKAEEVERFEKRVQDMLRRRDEFRRQLDELVRHASEAAHQGDLKTTNWVRRRLEAIHETLPAVLSKEQLRHHCEALRQCAERFERHEAARKLVERERAIGTQVKRLKGVIEAYAAQIAAGGRVDPVTREAFERAVARVEEYDDDWLADLMIELDCLLDDLRGSEEAYRRAARQADAFIRNVRVALKQVRRKIASLREPTG